MHAVRASALPLANKLGKFDLLQLITPFSGSIDSFDLGTSLSKILCALRRTNEYQDLV